MVWKNKEKVISTKFVRVNLTFSNTIDAIFKYPYCIMLSSNLLNLILIHLEK